MGSAGPGAWAFTDLCAFYGVTVEEMVGVEPVAPGIPGGMAVIDVDAEEAVLGATAVEDVLDYVRDAEPQGVALGVEELPHRARVVTPEEYRRVYKALAKRLRALRWRADG